MISTKLAQWGWVNNMCLIPFAKGLQGTWWTLKELSWSL